MKRFVTIWGIIISSVLVVLLIIMVMTPYAIHPNGLSITIVEYDRSILLYTCVLIVFVMVSYGTQIWMEYRRRNGYDSSLIFGLYPLFVSFYGLTTIWFDGYINATVVDYFIRGSRFMSQFPETYTSPIEYQAFISLGIKLSYGPAAYMFISIVLTVFVNQIVYVIMYYIKSNQLIKETLAKASFFTNKASQQDEDMER